jgi:two-component system sensor histidine kinase UhpB
MTRRLRPAGLDELGLPAALENFTESWRSRHTDVELKMALSGELEGLSELENITLYRLVQEGLTNVARHSEARRVEIRVSRTRGACDDEGVTLQLKDDGRGACGERNSKGLGLVGMRERIEALGGRLEIVTEPARGFHVSAWLPLQAAR